MPSFGHLLHRFTHFAHRSQNISEVGLCPQSRPTPRGKARGGPTAESRPSRSSDHQGQTEAQKSRHGTRLKWIVVLKHLRHIKESEASSSDFMAAQLQLTTCLVSESHVKMCTLWRSQVKPSIEWRGFLFQKCCTLAKETQQILMPNISEPEASWNEPILDLKNAHSEDFFSICTHSCEGLSPAPVTTNLTKSSASDDLLREILPRS